MNPQPRFTLVIVPIILLLIGKNLTKKQIAVQTSLFLIITLLVINPYIIQIKYDTNLKEFRSFFFEFPNFYFNTKIQDNLIQQDLSEIGRDYPNQTFIVGNEPDDYRYLAYLYWGKDIKEFVSIQDYELFLKNETTLASKTFCSDSKIQNRREICISVKLNKNKNDATNYASIKYAISLNQSLGLPNFKLVKKYRILYLYEKY